MKKLEKYNSSLDYTYIFGAFGTIELLEKKPQYALAVLVDPSFVSNDAFSKINKLAKENNIEIIIDEKLIAKIRDKSNIFVVGVFKKYKSPCTKGNHIILYGSYDVGTIGTIIRSLSGFEQSNLILINNNVDLYDEHLIRSSMGAYFNVNIESYSSIEEYKAKYNNTLYLISNEGKNLDTINKDEDYSLIFSNDRLEIDYNHLKFSQDISIENKINIILFTTYKAK